MLAAIQMAFRRAQRTVSSLLFGNGMYLPGL